MKNLSVKNKLILVSLTSVFTIVAMWAVMYFMEMAMKSNVAAIVQEQEKAKGISDGIALLQQLDAPGNDVLENWDYEGERVKLGDYSAQFEAHGAKLSQLFAADSGDLRELSAAHELVNALVVHATNVFDAAEIKIKATAANDGARARAASDRASSEMANMDQSFSAAAKVYRRLEAKQFDRITGLLDNNLATNQYFVKLSLAALFLASLVVVITGLFVSRSITTQLANVMSAVGEISKGNLDVKVEINSRDEIGQLALSFNKMADDLRAATSFRDNTIKSLGSSLIVLSPSGVIRLVNPATCTLLGYEEQELIGQPFRKVLPPGPESKHSSGLDVSIMVHDANMHYLARDRRSIPVSFSRSAMLDHSGRIEGFVCVAQDMSEQRMLEGQLRQAQKLEALGQLAAGIAHEINTPTQYVGDNTRFLRDAFDELDKIRESLMIVIEAHMTGAATSERLAQFVKTFQQTDLEYVSQEIPKAIRQSLEGVGRITKIVQSMKDFAHPGTTEKEAADLNRAIESTATIATNEWKYVADLVLDLDGNLPFVPCFIGEFNQVILNLIVNASHAIGAKLDGNGKGLITVSTRHEGDYAAIRVSDTGMGIPAAIQSRIFDPFFTTKEVGKGTGQGLAISHRVIVEKHGGSISFETEESAGTTFIVRLPFKPMPRKQPALGA